MNPTKELTVLRPTSQELAFLRWLRTNGGRGLLRTEEQFALADRVIRAGYVTASPSQEETPYTLTDLGREVLALEGF
jgi:hypothetical protein